MIFNWWTGHRRQFPWRETTDPYHIMVSEFMLQQTQTNRVVPKYLEFITKFPTLECLSQAEKIEVLKQWSGLGYNRRAMWLHEAAEKILSLGRFPQEPMELLKFKGIGKYTSNSIPIFAFNTDLVTVDTNITKIFREYGFISDAMKEKEIYRIARQLLPSGRSRDWHNALMDFGALNYNQKKKQNTSSVRFQGSTRQFRGKIIKILTSGVSLHFDELQKGMDFESQALGEILNKLVVDNLIQLKNNKYFI